MENLEVKLDSVVSEAKVDIALPTFVQTQGLPQDDALAFVKDCAEGKRKIAKAVRNKYEGTKGEASEITEYSTFDELSDKISQIPVEVSMGSAMEQNGGVLPFFDVYNETLKAMKEFAGYGFNGVCAFELDKWNYDTDHTITLGGASAYYTSDKGELITTDTEYRFKDIDQPNTNRFIVFFYKIEEGNKYSVPTNLPATSVLNLWCVKGTPLISFNGNYTTLSSINVYDGELVVKETKDFTVRSIALLNKLNIPHIVEVAGGDVPFYATNLKSVIFTNLTTISGGSNFLNQNVQCRLVDFPKLHKATKLIDWSYPPKIDIRIGNGIKDGIAGNIKILASGQCTTISTLTVAEGFKAKLDITGCNSLNRDVLLGIINNLANLTGTEYEDKLQLTLGTTLYNKLTDDDRLIATNKRWVVK